MPSSFNSVGGYFAVGGYGYVVTSLCLSRPAVRYLYRARDQVVAARVLLTSFGRAVTDAERQAQLLHCGALLVSGSARILFGMVIGVVGVFLPLPLLEPNVISHTGYSVAVMLGCTVAGGVSSFGRRT